MKGERKREDIKIRKERREGGTKRNAKMGKERRKVEVRIQARHASTGSAPYGVRWLCKQEYMEVLTCERMAAVMRWCATKRMYSAFVSSVTAMLRPPGIRSTTL